MSATEGMLRGTTAAPDAASVTARTATTRRNWELLLLLVALFIGWYAYLSVDLALERNGIPASSWGVLVALSAGFLAAHVVVRITAAYADPFMLPAAAALNLLGIAMIHRLDLAEEFRARLNNTKLPTPDVKSQLMWVAVALALFAMTLIFVRDQKVVSNYSYTCGLVGIVLLLLPLMPVIGRTVNGATLWVGIGPLSFQPSELAKILLTIFFADYLVEKGTALATIKRKILGIGIPRGRDLGPIVVAWAFAVLVLALEKDLGTALMFFGVFVVLLYVSTQRKSWLVIGGAMFAVAAVLGYLAFGHVRIRVMIWLDTWSYATDQGYQMAQSLFGLASGGILGTGLGQGQPQFIPFAKTDFITAALGEELGTTGFMAILLLYGLIVQRGLRAAVASRDPFGQLLAVGLATVLALQVFVVVGGVTRLIPLTGLTTPFLSYGGSALVCNWIMLALLMRISDRARRPQEVALPMSEAETAVVRL